MDGRQDPARRCGPDTGGVRLGGDEHAATVPDRPRLPWDPPDHFEKRIPDGDNRERLVCARCEFIHYQNPKIVAGAVCTWDDKILLAKRAIEPRKGFWTVPAGYMELGETTEQAAAARGPRRGLRHHRDRAPARHVQRGAHRPGADHVSRAAGERRRGGRRGERGSGAGRLGRHSLGAARLPDRGVGARPFPRRRAARPILRPTPIRRAISPACGRRASRRESKRPRGRRPPRPAFSDNRCARTCLLLPVLLAFAIIVRTSGKRTKSGGNHANCSQQRDADARWAGHAHGQSDAGILDPRLSFLGAEGRRRADAAHAAGRAAHRLPRHRRPGRHHGASLPAPLRLAVLRAQRGRRPALRLSRLEVRRRRQLPRHAERAAGAGLQGPHQGQGLQGGRARGLRLDLHGQRARKRRRCPTSKC